MCFCRFDGGGQSRLNSVMKNRKLKKLKNILRKSNFGFTKWCVGLRASLLLALTLGWMGAAQAAVVVADNFNFSGALTSNGWTALSGSGVAVINTGIGLNYTGLPSSSVGNAAVINSPITSGGSGEDLRKAFTSGITSGTIYTSFLINLTSATSGGDYFFAAYSSAATGGGYNGRIFAKTSGAGYVLGLTKSSTIVYDTTVRNFNTTYLVVLKNQISSTTTTDDTASIWVDPALASSEGTALLTSNSGNDITATTGFDGVVIRQGNATPAGRIDSILVGTTWADVTASAAIPPTVTTSALASSISSSGATLGGSISNTGGANATETGIFYSVTSGFANGTGTKVSTTGLNQGTGAFTQIVTGLSQNTTYYFKAFAANSAGPGYGTEQSFTTTAQSQAAPSVTASPSATVDANIEMTFTDNPSYRAAITDIKVGGTSLPTGAFSTLSAGKIVLSPSASSLLQSSGSKIIAITATGYELQNINQTILHGVATKLGILTQAVAPAANGGAFTTQPVVAVQDQYGNTVLTSTETVTAAVGTGDWILGGTVGVAAVNGVLAYNDLTAGRVGSMTAGKATFSSGGLTTVTSAGFDLPQPVLSLTSSANIYGEGTTGTGTITLPFVAPTDITVTVTSSSGANLQVGGGESTSVTILSGTSSADFPISAPTDGQIDADVALTLTATAGSFSDGTKNLTVANVDYTSPTVVINKFENGSPDKIELIVVGNGTPGTTVDLRGMIIKDHSSSNSNDGGGKYTFNSDSLWAAVRAGTIIVLANSTTATEDLVTGGTDWNLAVNLVNPIYFTKGSASMDIAGTDMIMIKAAGNSEAGSAGQIHALANGLATGTQTAAATMPKLVADVGSAGVVYAENPNGSLADYNGTRALLGAKTFGSPNNLQNASFLASLRGTSEILLETSSLALVDKAGNAGQSTTVTITMLPAPSVNTTVTLSSDQSSRLTLPATVTVPANNAQATFTATATADGVDTDSVTATITAAASEYNSSTLQIGLVDTDYSTPPVVINEYANAAPSDFIELLVLQDRLDMRGMILKDFSGTVGSADGGGRSTFSAHGLWSTVRAGTLIVVTTDNTATEDLDPDDFVLVVKRSNSIYFSNSGSIDISASDMVAIKAAGSPADGINGSLHVLAGGSPEGANFILAPWPKVITTGTSASGTAVQLLTPTSSPADLNGGDASLAQGGATPTSGIGNGTANTAYINGLKPATTLQAPEITSLLTANIQQDASFTYTITANNGGGSFGAVGLPAGLSIDSTTGVISGTVAATGNYTISLYASNADWTGVGLLLLTVSQAPPVITSGTTAAATVGTSFEYQITASYFPSSYGATGLPAGLTISTTTGLISGTPTVGGVFSVGLIASNSAGSGSATLTMTIPVPNSSPTNIGLTATSIAENNEVNASVGTLSTTDADSADTFTYSLVVGSGDTDNASFNISGNSLRAGVAFDFETKSSYTVRVRTTDSGGATFETTFTITVANVVEGSTYSSWLGIGTPSDAAFLDYVFGAATPGTLNPTLKPSVAVADGNLVLTYHVRQGTVGLRVTPKTSADLAAGPSGWVTTDVTVADVGTARTVNGVSVQQKTASVPVSGTKKFLKVEAVQE